jgi:hypothetical protein
LGKALSANKKSVDRTAAPLRFTSPIISIMLLVDTAVISRLVEHGSGGAIVNADVSLRNDATGLESKTTSNEDGLYVSPPLPPGDYQVVAKMPGFDTVVPHVRLEVAQRNQRAEGRETRETFQADRIDSRSLQSVAFSL